MLPPSLKAMGGLVFLWLQRPRSLVCGPRDPTRSALCPVPLHCPSAPARVRPCNGLFPPTFSLSNCCSVWAQMKSHLHWEASPVSLDYVRSSVMCFLFVSCSFYSMFDRYYEMMCCLICWVLSITLHFFCHVHYYTLSTSKYILYRVETIYLLKDKMDGYISNWGIWGNWKCDQAFFPVGSWHSPSQGGTLCEGEASFFWEMYQNQTPINIPRLWIVPPALKLPFRDLFSLSRYQHLMVVLPVFVGFFVFYSNLMNVRLKLGTRKSPTAPPLAPGVGEEFKFPSCDSLDTVSRANVAELSLLPGRGDF